MRDGVFVSYSHQDRAWLERLAVHLRPRALDLWDDRRIAPGTPWRAEIDAALARARVAVLLVSADFLASDFITQVELPALLQAAAAEGVVVLPLLVSASRYASMPKLSQWQALNDPALPLVALDRAGQEALFARTADVVEGLLRGAAPPPPEASAVSPLDSIDLPACLQHLGCADAPAAAQAVAAWLQERVDDTRWRSAATELPLAADAQAFADDLLAWCAPHHARGAALYASPRHVADTWRTLKGALPPAPEDEGTADRLVRIHRHLLASGRLSFLPARLLLGGALPAHDDEITWFSGRFTLQPDRAELARVPGALQALDTPGTSLYSVVATVFQNADPFVYPMLRLEGELGGERVVMPWSRRHLAVHSMTATALADALRGAPMRLRGMGRFRRGPGGVELNALACEAC